MKNSLFDKFQSYRMMCLLKTLKGYTTDNLRFPKAGELVEMAIAEFSNGTLRRVNQVGVDLVSVKGFTTVESKVTQFKNKSGLDVRQVILKNRRSAGSHEDKFADVFVFTDVVNGKMAVVTSDRLYNLKDNGATVTASVDCKPEDFLFFGFDNADSDQDYFDYAEEADLKYIRSF